MGRGWDEDGFFFFRTGVRGSCFAFVNFRTSVPGPCSAFVDFLFFLPTDEDFFVFFQTGVRGSCPALVDFPTGGPGPASDFVDFLFFARKPFTLCFDFLAIRVVGVFGGTDFFFFFAALPESGTVEIIFLFAFMFVDCMY